jgi:hypothetical protein
MGKKYMIFLKFIGGMYCSSLEIIVYATTKLNIIAPKSNPNPVYVYKRK